jgi:hypothetical protein
MRNQHRLDFVINNFSLLELQLASCMDYIPFIDINRDVVSPKFIPIITEACALTESIFREITGDKGKRYSFKKYAELHEPSLSLEGNISLFLSYPLQLLEPYRDWTKQQPAWWKAYNALKHDRLRNYHVATYANVVAALAGLHQLMSRCEIFIGSFLRAGWIDTEDAGLEERLGVAAHLGALHAGPPSMAVESKLFVSPTVENFINYTLGDDLLYLDVDYSIAGLSNRVRSFIFAHEDW